MTIEEIMARRDELNQKLHVALASMQKTDEVILLREAIKENQRQCPHFSAEYNFAVVDNICPYCGGKLV